MAASRRDILLAANRAKQNARLSEPEDSSTIVDEILAKETAGTAEEEPIRKQAEQKKPAEKTAAKKNTAAAKKPEKKENASMSDFAMKMQRRKKAKRKDRTVTFLLYSDVLEELEQEADSYECSRNDLINEILKERYGIG